MNKFGLVFSKVTAGLGILGTIVCTAAVIGVWLLASRMTQINEDLFSSIDSGLAALQRRAHTTQRRIEESTIKTEAFQLWVKETLTIEASERLAAALELESRVERLDSGLEQVEIYLALSEGSIHGIRQSLSFGKSLGAPMDLDRVDALLASLETMQKELGLAAHAIDEIRRRITDMDSPEKVELHFNDILRLVSVVAVKLSNLDSRVEGLLGKLANVQANAKVAQLRTNSYVMYAAIIATLIVLWMMAGQIALVGAFRRNHTFEARASAPPS
jgi:hypothetical protein